MLTASPWSPSQDHPLALRLIISARKGLLFGNSLMPRVSRATKGLPPSQGYRRARLGGKRSGDNLCNSSVTEFFLLLSFVLIKFGKHTSFFSWNDSYDTNLVSMLISSTGRGKGRDKEEIWILRFQPGVVLHVQVRTVSWKGRWWSPMFLIPSKLYLC